jgi:hypothetical protein
MVTRERLLRGLGSSLLVAWSVWWLVSILHHELLGAARTWIVHPALGADFWSQTDYAARRWVAELSPYGDGAQLFHYPPIVVRLFAWTPFLSPVAAMRVWIFVNVVIVCAGTWVAHRHRRSLGLGRAPFPLVLAAVLFSFPVLFELERANFDLITLVAILGCSGIAQRQFRHADLLGGVVLSVGPWVKLYPGLLAVSLVALRRWRMLVGFILGGLAIGLAAPAETLYSFRVLRLAVEAVRPVVLEADYFVWAHSLTNFWAKLAHGSEGSALSWTARVPPLVFSVVVLAPLIAWVHLRVARTARPSALSYPLLLWTVSAASFVPEIANDYSLAFLPIAAVAVYRFADPWRTQVGMALLVLWCQPLRLPIAGEWLLWAKVAGLAAVGAGLVERARTAPALTPEVDAPSPEADVTRGGCSRGTGAGAATFVETSWWRR